MPLTQGYPGNPLAPPVQKPLDQTQVLHRLIWAGLFIATLLFISPATVMLLFFGLLPSFVALITDRSDGKYAMFCVLGLNFSGLFPFLANLWFKTDSIDAATNILTDVFSLFIIYGAAGFGVMRLNKKTRKITMECFPRNVDITDPKTKQYLGWPKTIDQTDNYGRKAKAYLPRLVIKGQRNPVVKVIDESTGKWIYAIRINGTEFRPKVFADGSYTIEVGEGAGKKVLKGVKSIGLNGDKTINVAF